MLLKNIPADEIFIVCGYTDMRKSIDGLALIVKTKLEINPCSKGKLFLFCGKKRDRLKALLWEPTGFLLLYKRLENGSFKWPMDKVQARKLNPMQLSWLLQGISIDQKTSIQDAVGSEF